MSPYHQTSDLSSQSQIMQNNAVWQGTSTVKDVLLALHSNLYRAQSEREKKIGKQRESFPCEMYGNNDAKYNFPSFHKPRPYCATLFTGRKNTVRKLFTQAVTLLNKDVLTQWFK